MKDGQSSRDGRRFVGRGRARIIGLTVAGALTLLAVVIRPGRQSRAAQSPVYSVVYTFQGGTDGSFPQAGVIADSAGNLYGTTPFGGIYNFGTVFKIDASGNETILYNFTGGSDGAYPYFGVVSDPHGNLYGTTLQGGLGGFGAGVVFEVGPTGNERTLYSFTGGTDGATPEAGLLRDAVGNLYGTTAGGGAHGFGSVFELTPPGSLSTLYSFAGFPTDGESPFGGLVRDSVGNLYGTTLLGGSGGAGTIFKLDTLNNETVLTDFTNGTDGGFPVAPLVRDSAGNLYGTTGQGGTYGHGVIFELDTGGTETVLHAFRNQQDGGFPTAGLIRDATGNLYGTAEEGGRFAGNCKSYDGCGVIFKLSPQGNETRFYTFTGGTDGALPDSSLFPYNGYLYGTAETGGNLGADCSGVKGTVGCGVVFKVSLQ